MGAFNFLSAFLLLLVHSCLQSACGNAEVRVLMEIKASLDPENKYLSSWTSDGDPCGGSFLGVACNEHLKVGNISLQGKGLTGKIPPAVAGLKCLSGLYLHYNSLSGDIPIEISNLTELSELYLNVNSLSGSIPPEIGSMPGLQVLQLCCNQLNGTIPPEMGLLKKLNILALQHNRLAGQIPSRIGNLAVLKWLDLSFNQLFGPIPSTLARMPFLEILDVENNTLSGVVPSALKRLNEGFHYKNNPGLCGVGFSSLRVCTAFDNLNVNQIEPFSPVPNTAAPDNIPQAAKVDPRCNQNRCQHSSKFRKVAIVAGVVTSGVTLIILGLLGMVWHRRRKQKVWSKCETSDGRLSIDQTKEICRTSPSPLKTRENSCGWDPTTKGHNFCELCPESLQNFKFNVEEIESATQYFSEANLLGKSKFSAVYKGILKDRSVVAIKSINVHSCKSDESEFKKGLSLLTSLRHENLARLRGFCCSKSRGECFLVYDFASKGALWQYLDGDKGSRQVLDWPARVSIIIGIARGVGYLHSSEADKPPMVHRNVSVEKVLLDQDYNPLIIDSGLLKLLADDIVFSALKVSAALGYMAPEYITTGRFTEKSDVYAFGVIILQILSGKSNLTNATRQAAVLGSVNDFIDENLGGQFSEVEAAKITKIAVACLNDVPDFRPTMEMVIDEVDKSSE